MNFTKLFERQEYGNRIKKVQKSMSDNGIDVLIIQSFHPYSCLCHMFFVSDVLKVAKDFVGVNSCVEFFMTELVR